MNNTIISINANEQIKGGADRFFVELNKLLRDKEHQVFEFTNSNVSVNKFIQLYNVFYNQNTINRFKKVIKETQPSIAHLHNIYHRMPYEILSILKKNKIKTIFWLHDYKWICPNHQLYTNNATCKKCKKHQYKNSIINKCQNHSTYQSIIVWLFAHFVKFKGFLSYVDYFVAPSQFVKNTFVEFGFPESKIIPLHHFNYFNHASTPELQGREGGLYVGRIEENKGIIDIISIYKKTGKLLNVVGDGNALQRAKNIANFSPNIRFHGYQNPDQVSVFYQQAKYTIIPSKWYEVFGLAVLESYVHGTPVIASNIGGLKEIIIDNVTGYLIDPVDSMAWEKAINEADNNTDKLTQMGNSAKQIVLTRFEKEAYYKKLLSNELI